MSLFFPDSVAWRKLLRSVFSLVLSVLTLNLVSCSSPTDRSFINAQSLGNAPKPKALYRFRPGDIIQVDVFQEPLMTTRQRVLGDGTINIGLIGAISVGGKTIDETRNLIVGKLRGTYLVNPQINITVLAYAPRRFTVWGYVSNAGSYIIPPEEVMFLPAAIATAGGQTAHGNLKKVIITRVVDGEVRQIRVNSLEPEMQAFAIEEGDNIFVTETKF